MNACRRWTAVPVLLTAMVAATENAASQATRLDQAAVRQEVSDARPSPVPSRAERPPLPRRVHAGALAELVDELGGRHVLVVNARLIAVLNPQAFLVESGTSLRSFGGNRDRVLVLIHEGVLHVPAELAVGHTVQVLGTARTVLGMQVTREVPWPQELTRQAIDRYEIRAVVLAASVRTADGVDLTTPTRQ